MLLKSSHGELGGWAGWADHRVRKRLQKNLTAVNTTQGCKLGPVAKQPFQQSMKGYFLRLMCTLGPKTVAKGVKCVPTLFVAKQKIHCYETLVCGSVVLEGRVDNTFPLGIHPKPLAFQELMTSREQNDKL